jgi:chitinase
LFFAEAYKQITELKEENPCLKVLIAIGGWNEMSEKYSLVRETYSHSLAFNNPVLIFCSARRI